MERESSGVHNFNLAVLRGNQIIKTSHTLAAACPKLNILKVIHIFSDHLSYKTRLIQSVHSQKTVDNTSLDKKKPPSHNTDS